MVTKSWTVGSRHFSWQTISLANHIAELCSSIPSAGTPALYFRTISIANSLSCSYFWCWLTTVYRHSRYRCNALPCRLLFTFVVILTCNKRNRLLTITKNYPNLMSCYFCSVAYGLVAILSQYMPSPLNCYFLPWKMCQFWLMIIEEKYKFRSLNLAYFCFCANRTFDTRSTFKKCI